MIESFTLEQLNDVRVTFATSFTEAMRICTGIAFLGLIAALATHQRRPTSIKQKERQMEKLITDRARKRIMEVDASSQERV